ncbi:LCP family protein [Sporosarcina sp. HYO08]|uniref:LCP family protein n=1 Tax=Sporosarcina sp. HYO08 TaxID=1759557 RepID=UPI0007913D44|nr:LCP family protein [Sporosarcina sp. HYO08]KXH81757.1 transcriptional regulator [Sporosarcina sp. HYO08]
MEDHYERPTRRRRKKLRIGRVIMLFTTLCFVGIGFFCYFQYQEGKSMAKGNVIDPGSFKGDAIDPNYTSIENYLLLGIDNDGSGRYRTDTMMVLSWDKHAGDMRVVSFMRDIYADIPGYKPYKLNTAYYLGRVQTIKDTITGMFGVPIHHYAIVDFDNFESIVDITFPKGVEIDVKKEMSEKIGVTLLPGKKRLNGKELLGYARFRADAEGDFGRVARQQEVIKAIKDEAMKPGTVLQIPKLVGALSGYIQTDITSKDEISYAFSLLLKKGANISTMTIPVEGSYAFKYYPHAGSVIEIDREKNRGQLEKFLNMKLD